MAAHEDIDVSEFAPRAWQAACELVGGADRLAAEKPFPWTDGFIVNLWQDADEPWQPASPASPGWHVDGGFFRHYLDSPEQGLLALVLWSDVVHQGGPTFVATDSVARSPGSSPTTPRGCCPGPTGVDAPSSPTPTWSASATSSSRPPARSATSTCCTRSSCTPSRRTCCGVPRFITNSTLFLAEPMRFDRPDPADHSLVERAVLRALDVDSYDFAAAGPRERVVPDSAGAYDAQAVEERRRLAAAGHPNFR